MLLFAGLAAGAAALPIRRARAAAQGAGDGPCGLPFGQTDEQDLSASDTSLPPRARAMIRIGEDAIAREDAAAASAVFHPQFHFHGPGGAEPDREKLWAYFAVCRAAFAREFLVMQENPATRGIESLSN